MVAKIIVDQKADRQQSATTYLEFEQHLEKSQLSLEESRLAKAQASSCFLTDTTATSNLMVIPSCSSGNETQNNSTAAKCGRWSLNEKLLFLYGLSVFGKGRWKKISAYVPAR